MKAPVSELSLLKLQVERNEQAHKRSTRRERVIYAIIVIGLLLGSYWLDNQQDQLAATNTKVAHNSERLEDQQYEQCIIANNNAVALNKTLDQIITAVRTSPDLSEAQKKERIAFYEATKSKIPVCGDKPIRPAPK